jgi:hypothetical protein
MIFLFSEGETKLAVAQSFSDLFQQLPEITDNDLTFCQTSRRCWYVLNFDGD